MHTYLIDEIEKLRSDRISAERVGSILMSLNRQLKTFGDKKPTIEDKSYSAWEEKYYEIKHLIEYADRLKESMSEADTGRLEECIDDLQIAAMDFQMIYGGLNTIKVY